MEASIQYNWPSMIANGIPLADPVAVSFNGDVIVLARRQSTPTSKMYYNVRHNNPAAQDGNLEYSGWYELDLSTIAGNDAGSSTSLVGLRELGAGLVAVPASALSALPPGAHAFEPADLPFVALSDERYIYVYRPSANGTLYLDRFILLEVPVPQASNTQARRDSDATTPTRYQLQRNWELRYRVSGKKDTPADEKDILGYSDMMGKPFVEPTLELGRLPRLIDGKFTVVLLPTSVVGQRRWCFFVATTENRIEVVTWPQSSDGLIDFLEEKTEPDKSAPAASFAFSPVYANGQALTLRAGISAAVYAEQDQGQDGIKLRRAMRLMVTVPVSAAGLGLPAALAVIDFGILPSGRLPLPVSAVLASPLLDGTLVDGTFAPTVPLPARFLLPASVVHVSCDSTIYAYLLGTVRPSAKPYLFDGGDGLLHCYYAGVEGTEAHPFLVAQYSPEVQRPFADLAWTAGNQQGALNLVAQRPGTTFNQLKLAVADAKHGNPGSDLCDLIVDYGANLSGIGTEQWTGLPRSVGDMADILNGNASGEIASRGVQEGSLRYFDYSGIRQQTRLGVTNASGQSGWLTLVSTRLDLALEDARAIDSGLNRLNLVVRFRQANHLVTQTWANVPSNADQMRIVLRGDAPSFSYQPQAGDPWAFALSAAGGSSTMLFFSSAAASAKDTSITISAGSTKTTVNVRIMGLNFDKSWKDLPADSALLAKDLLDKPEVTAIFPVISASDNRGRPYLPITVDLQEVNQPVDLRVLCLLFATLPATIAGDVAATKSPATAAVLQGHSQAPPLTGAQLVNRLVALSAAPTQSPNNGIAGVVANQAVAATPAAGNGSWVAAKPLYALKLADGQAMQVPTDLPRRDALAPSQTFTVETWLRPDLLTTGTKSVRILSFNGARAGQTPTSEVVPSSFLGVFAQPALQFDLIKKPGTLASPSNVYVTPNPLFSPGQAFTFEIWIKPAAQVSSRGTHGSLLQILNVDTYACAMELGIVDDLQLSLAFNDGTNRPIHNTQTPLQAGVWTHIAVTGECIDTVQQQWRVSLYVNGNHTSITNTQLTIAWSPTGPNGFFVGGAGNVVSGTAAASFAEVRYWEIRRTRTDIQDSLFFTLAGTEPGLIGYWPLSEKAIDRASVANHCMATGSGFNGILNITHDQDVISSADGAFLALAAGIGGAPPLKVNAFLRSTHWNHVAVSYRAGSAVRLSAAERSVVDCGNDRSLNVTGNFSVEAWIQVDKSDQPLPQTLLGKWGKDASQQSFWLGLNAQGQLNLQAQYQYGQSNNAQTVKLVDEKATTGSLRDGQPHHVAATVATTTESQTVTVTVRFYVDGVQAGSFPTTIPSFTTAVQATTTNMVLGAAAMTPAGVAGNTAPEAQRYLTGMLTGVVLWSRAIDSADIVNSIEKRSAMQRDGAIAAWWFREQAGVDAVDSVAGLVAKLSSNDLWAVFNRLSELLFYVNGRRLVGAESLTPEESALSIGYPGGSEQFILGGYKNDVALTDNLHGQFNELRLWQQVRSARQIADMRFSRLVGNETGLSGYWTFDDESLADRSPFGNNGVMWQHAPAVFVLSAAPVSSEGPAVRNIYGGQITEFQQLIVGTPAVTEFSEITREPTSALEPDPKDGQVPKLLGSLQRAYYYTTGTVNLTPGFYAGGLRLVYFGQVQTGATLLGYIEGAPPVPSENLTRPYWGSATGYFSYFNASSIAFTNTETTTLAFNSSYAYGSTLDHTTTGGLAWKTKVNFQVPLTGVASGITDNEFKLGIKEKGGFATQDVTVENATSSWSFARTDSLSLRGNWENPDKLLNTQVGRRFLPDNVGYGLVSSLTADVYLTFNAATGAAVGRSVVPNPYIPPDNNIVTFRIDPQYTKNGTLDGKVGLYTDADYLEDGKVPGSYFRPIEAYRLKREIAKKADDEEKYYEQFNAYGRALSSTRSLNDQEPERLVERSSKGNIPRKGIANTYVWTAAGGMHAEQEQFTDQFTTTFTGGYNVNNQFGPVFEFKGTAGAGVMVGGFFTLDWLGGFKIDITATKTRTKANALGLNVVVVGEPALLGGWNQQTCSYGEQPVPGKVASYRFNTFYLPPDGDSGRFLMDSVVDREWLRRNEPDAVTLRTANASNPAWRILHRVTYVNRVPPGPDNMPNQMMPAPLSRIIDVSNNEELIALILSALGGNQPTPANIGASVMAVLNPSGQGGNYPPSRLTTLVPWWDEFLGTTRGPNVNQANYRLLQELQLDVLKYVLAGFADGTLPWKKFSKPL